MEEKEKRKQLRQDKKIEKKHRKEQKNENCTVTTDNIDLSEKYLARSY
jgi:hypothetical protein